MTPDVVRRRFGGKWAKIEIFLGFTAAIVGLFFVQMGTGRSFENVEWALVAPGAFLFVLGGYLALAGQRSHIYRSILEAEVTLIKELNRPANG